MPSYLAVSCIILIDFALALHMLQATPMTSPGKAVLRPARSHRLMSPGLPTTHVLRRQLSAVPSGQERAPRGLLSCLEHGPPGSRAGFWEHLTHND